MTKPILSFIVPAHGRHAVAEVCLRQLRRTCDVLSEHGTLATAVIIADDENLEIAQDLDFHTVTRDNAQLGRKINDGYFVAGNDLKADYMVPLGSDDWIDPRWILLPQNGETVATHLSTVVNEDCTRLAYLDITFGDGVRVYSRRTLEKVGFRPAEEHRSRAIDASTHRGTDAPSIVWHDTHPLAIVDFKTRENLNSYHGCASTYGSKYRQRFQQESEHADVWERLAAVYPTEAISEMRALHDRELVTV